jgi:protein-tyrosine phosphatase
MTDYHCHILPEIDDGSKNVEMSVGMVDMLRSQGVTKHIATSHFYSHRNTIENFLNTRQTAYEKLIQSKPDADILLGAEVAIERGLSELKGLDKLCIQGTNLLLLELPYIPFESWLLDEVYNITCEYDVQPIIAHINRYITWYSKRDMNEVLSHQEYIFQINNDAFESRAMTKFVLKLIKDDYTLVFGSDTHNLSERKPNFDIMQKVLTSKLKGKFQPLVERSNGVLLEYTLPQTGV